jgi:thioredoxin reductase
LEKGTARWVRNYDLWRKERKVQETGRHELRYDVVVVGGGSAGLSAALVLGRSRRQTLVVDAGEPRNAPSSGVHGFFSRDGISPEELLEIGREQLEPYPSVEVRSERVIGTSGVNGDLEVILDDGSVVRARKLVLATGVVDELPEKPGFEELWGRGVYHCPYCHGCEIAAMGQAPAGVKGDPRTRETSVAGVYVDIFRTKSGATLQLRGAEQDARG